MKTYLHANVAAGGYEIANLATARTHLSARPEFTRLRVCSIAISPPFMSSGFGARLGFGRHHESFRVGGGGKVQDIQPAEL